MADVLITPASGIIEFKDGSSNVDGVIELLGTGDLQISAPGGDVIIGNTVSDLYIGDGTNNVDIVFEQDGEIRGLTNKTVSLGQTDSYIKIVGGLKDSNNQVGLGGSILISTGAGVSWSSAIGAGAQGAQGTQGTQGRQGVQGTLGTQGSQGTLGTQGNQGRQGVQGTLGTQGNQGVQGLSNQGSQGTQGTQGRQGTQGVAGQNAGQGSQGTQGTQGTQGRQGTQGTQGTQGRQGVQGASDGGVAIIDDSTTNQDWYVGFLSASSGVAKTVYVSTNKLQFNPSSGAFGIGTIFNITPYDNLNNGTLSFEASAGQLFSITNNLTSGSIFSVNDVSGIPSIDVDADGTVLIAPYGSGEYVGVGITEPTVKLDVNGDIRLRGGLYDINNNVGVANSILVSTGTGVSWSSAIGAGAQGAQGTQGTQGRQGVQGLSNQGTQGTLGSQGTQGNQGRQGVQGVAGQNAGQGSQGTQGNQGRQGVQGVAGQNAGQGSQGTQGTQGTQGRQGTQGTQNTQGTQGLAGTESVAEQPRGGGSDKIFYENDITITTDYTITTNKNAITAGPVGINTGVTITIPANSEWSIV